MLLIESSNLLIPVTVNRFLFSSDEKLFIGFWNKFLGEFDWQKTIIKLDQPAVIEIKYVEYAPYN